MLNMFKASKNKNIQTTLVSMVLVSSAKLNSFVPNGPFLYPLKTSRKRYGFLMLSGGRERVHWEQMGLFERNLQIHSAYFVESELILPTGNLCEHLFFSIEVVLVSSLLI